MTLDSAIKGLREKRDLRQIIVLTVNAKAQTDHIGVVKLEDGQLLDIDRDVLYYSQKEVDKVADDNRMKQTKRVYVRV